VIEFLVMRSMNQSMRNQNRKGWEKNTEEGETAGNQEKAPGNKEKVADGTRTNPKFKTNLPPEKGLPLDQTTQNK
jgi:hypothetical protein